MSTGALKQFLLLAIILSIFITLGWQLHEYIPGVLGAITLYILLRKYYFHLTVIKNWKKWLTAALFILGAIIIFVLPIYWLLQMLLPKISAFANNPGKLTDIMNVTIQHLQVYIPQLNVDETQIKNLIKSAASELPGVIGATLNMLVNAALAFFLLFFMLIDGRKIERALQRFLPLKGENIDNIWEATRIMVVSNAIGLPVMAACQAFTATVGYYFFGVDNPILWGIITGVFSLFPVVGTTVIWLPMSLYLFSIGENGHAIGLLAFGFLVIVNLDHLLRFTLLKKIGNVHPVITVLGILAGVPLFGFMGFIFGPLLISYLLLMIEIYKAEFSPYSASGNIKPPQNL